MGLIEIPPKLQEVLGEEATQDLIELFNKILRDERQELVNIAEDRFAEIVKGELSLVRKDLKEYESRINALFDETINKALEEITISNKNLKQEITDSTQSFIEKMSSLIDAQKEELAEFQGQTRETLSDLKTQVENLFKEELTQRLKELEDQYAKESERIITTLLDSIIREVKQENEGIKEGLSYLKAEIEKKIDSLRGEVEREINVQIEKIKTELESLLDSITSELNNKISPVLEDVNKKLNAEQEAINYNIDSLRDSLLKTLSDKFEYYYTESEKERRGLRASFVGWMFFFGIIELGALGFIIYYLAK